MKPKYDWGETLQGDEVIEAEVKKFDQWLNDYMNDPEREETEISLPYLGDLFYGKYVKTQPWGKNASDRRVVFDAFSLGTFKKHAWWQDRLAKPFFRRQRKQELINRNIENKRCNQSKNLGKVKRLPQHHTLYDIGPNKYFLELTPELIGKVEQGIERVSVKGLTNEEIETIENEIVVDWFRGVIGLFDDDWIKKIIQEPETYFSKILLPMLTNALFDYAEFVKKKREDLIKLIIMDVVPRIRRDLKQIMKKQGTYYRTIEDEKTGEVSWRERSLVEEMMGDGYITFRSTVEKIRKDFWGEKGGIRGKAKPYYLTSLQNLIKKDFRPKEETPTDLLTQKEETSNLLVDEITGGRKISYPRDIQPKKRRVKKRPKPELKLKDDDFQKMKKPERKKEIYDLFYNKKITREDIALKLGITEKTVQRDLKEIKDYIKKHSK